MNIRITAVLAALSLVSFVTHAADRGFTSLFNGKDLSGWKVVGAKGGGYNVKDGVISIPKGGGGNLYTEKEYENFVLRFEFRTEPGSNNGLGIRTPLEGDAAYVGMELQILDDSTPKYGNLRPEQYHGSIYDVFAAKRGALKKPGEWNKQEVTANGRKIKVVLNGKTILNEDINEVTDPKVIAKHPGLFRDRGHIGFLGHNDPVDFRNIQIKELPSKKKENRPPPGFKALFNAKNLKGWKGLLKGPNDNPAKRAKLTPEQLAAEQEKADQRMLDHWKVEDGTLVFSGKGDSLCTAKDYADVEMLVDWKIGPKGDSGIYLRGTPQVQIWDHPEGSGAWWNNQKNSKVPIKKADKPVGEWNTFRIINQGDKLTVFLNGELVVHNVTMENYWEREKPLYPSGQIELQNHGNPLYFKNIYIRELPQTAAAE